MHRQYEMLEQQILAEQHGLSFSAYIPSAKSLNPVNLVKAGPMVSLKQEEINSLVSVGWKIIPPTNEASSKEEQLYAMMVENAAMSERIKSLLADGVKVSVEGSEG